MIAFCWSFRKLFDCILLYAYCISLNWTITVFTGEPSNRDFYLRIIHKKSQNLRVERKERGDIGEGEEEKKPQKCFYHVIFSNA